MRDPGSLPADDAELEPQAPRAGRDRLVRMRHAELRATEHVDEVERTGGCDGVGQCRERRNALDLAFVRVDRDAVEPVSQQRGEDALRRPRGVGRGADDGDPSRRPQDPFDAVVVEDRDRTAALLEVEIGGCPVALVAGQWAASRSYG
jgi:hypothetical protein